MKSFKDILPEKHALEGAIESALTWRQRTELFCYSYWTTEFDERGNPIDAFEARNLPEDKL